MDDCGMEMGGCRELSDCIDVLIDGGYQFVEVERFMRLIDADALMEKLPVVEKDKQISLIGAVADVVVLISDAPTIDAVPVVRCKDCKYRFTDNCPMFFEELTYNEDDGYDWIERDHTSDNGFCNEGARMDGEDDDE
jgi:hypothetical protein